MLLSRSTFRAGIPALAASIPIIIIPITVLSILLAASQSLHLSSAETTSWIISVYGLPGLLTLGFVLRYRQPLFLTGNVFALIFFASLGGQVSYPELVGASMLAGGIVLLVAIFNLTDRLAAWIPAPIVLGLLAGAVMPYVAGVFNAMRDEPVIVGGAFLAFLLSRRFLTARIPAILPALVVGLVLAALTGRLGQMPSAWSLPRLAMTTPSFSLQGVATVTPVLVVLIVLQSNLPSVVYLHSQGYHPPERVIDGVGGVATAVGSLLGPTAVSLALPLVALAAAPEAGELPVRHRSVYIGASAIILIALLAGVAAMLPIIIPLPLLLTLAGLSLVPVLASALQAITRGPLLLGPLFAFAIALSKIALFGFGPFFWSLVLGMLISVLLEGRELNVQRANMSKAGRVTP
jgi:benzoate membrane transport protein